MGNSGKIKILAVDDEKSNRLILREALRGYDVVLASGVDDALRKMREHPVNLVITDIVMPEKDGYELLKFVKKYYKHVPVILLSAQEGMNMVTKGLKLGALSAVEKPFDKFDLCTAVDFAVGTLRKPA